MNLEVADADRLDLTGLVERLQRPPGFFVFTSHWPVDQIQIEIIQTKFAQARFISGQRLFVSEVGIPYLRGDKQGFTRDTGLLQAFADALSNPRFIPVDRCRINAAITVGNGGFDRVYEFGSLLDLEYAKTQPRHLHSIVQRSGIL
ncbi:hypothetical protein D3C74_305840 [compost metagenome]